MPFGLEFIFFKVLIYTEDYNFSSTKNHAELDYELEVILLDLF